MAWLQSSSHAGKLLTFTKRSMCSSREWRRILSHLGFPSRELPLSDPTFATWTSDFSLRSASACGVPSAPARAGSESAKLNQLLVGSSADEMLSALVIDGKREASESRNSATVRRP